MVCGHEVRANNLSGHDLYHFQFNCSIMIIMSDAAAADNLAACTRRRLTLPPGASLEAQQLLRTACHHEAIPPPCDATQL